jgi:hypothetical protein
MLPARKPVPGRAPPAPYSQPTQMPVQYSQNNYPYNASSAAPPVRVSPPMSQQQFSHTRRTPSVGTSSSSNSASTNTQRTAPANYASSVRRSTSSRSTSTTSPTSYVALMRKQKATVWCDRAQHEDPRILAAQRQAKMRATMEVAGSQHAIGSGRTSTSSSGLAGGMRSKIRHHGAVKASAYNAVAHSGAGVPMRLSATEVEEGDSDDEPRYHQRSGSGRSSLGSGQRISHLQRGYTGTSYSGGSTPSAHSPLDSRSNVIGEETPTANYYGQQSDDYFGQPGGQGGSGSSGEAEKNFGRPAGLPVQQRAKPELERKTSDELRRRGSVDDRTMTMSAGRLFVANPDLSD